MREQWSSRGGFILASIGAAVGLGNICRFAYVAGENGDGALPVACVLLAIFLGWIVSRNARAELTEIMGSSRGKLFFQAMRVTPLLIIATMASRLAG